jgi:DNA polymerase-3 subunit delta'
MFESVLGQEHITQHLLHAFQRRHLPHAMIFGGPEGSGKDAVALEMAKLILCPNQKGDDGCSSCRRAAKIIHPDLQFIVPLPRSTGDATDQPLGVKLTRSAEEELNHQLQEKAQNPYLGIQLPGARFILIDQIRALKRMASLRAFEQGAKVYILSQAHNMTEDAQVSLLKILEEPPPNTYIILTTSSDTALLPTIRSRCQHIGFQALPATLIERALIDHRDADPDHARRISKMADGNYRRALTLLRDDSVLQRDQVLAFLRASYTGKPLDIQLAVLQLAERQTVTDILVALRSMLSFLHDAWTLQMDPSADALGYADYRDTLGKFSKILSRHDIPQFIDLVEQAIADIEGNVIPNLVLLTLALDLHRIFHHKPFEYTRTTT